MLNKKFASAAAASMMALSLAACSGGESSTVDSSASASETAKKYSSNEDLTQEQRDALAVFEAYAQELTSRDATMSAALATDVATTIGESLSAEEFATLTDFDFVVDFVNSLPAEKQAELAEKTIALLPEATLNTYSLDGMTDAEKVDFAMRVTSYEGIAVEAAQGNTQKDFRVTEGTVVTQDGDRITFDTLTSSVYDGDEKIGDVPPENFHPLTFVKVDDVWKVDAKDWSERQIQHLKDAGMNDMSAAPSTEGATDSATTDAADTEATEVTE